MVYVLTCGIIFLTVTCTELVVEVVELLGVVVFF